jgi:HPt (histidine-containing phosphotransfer) domain-containing protein
MDCQMPVLDGFEATRRLRDSEHETARRRTPVIAMTAAVSSEDRAEAYAAGMDDFVSKPVRGVQLRTALDRWVPTETHAGGAGTSRQPAAADTTHDDFPERIDRGRWQILLQLSEEAGEDMLGDIVGAFEAETVHVTALREALDNDDADLARRSAHALKGSSSNVGATSLATVCAKVESLADAGDLTTAADFLDTVAREQRLAAAALAELTGSSRSPSSAEPRAEPIR